VAQAAQLGYGILAEFTDPTRIDRDTRTIHIAAQQPPLSRLVDLAVHVGMLTLEDNQVQTIPTRHRPRTPVAHTQPAPAARGQDAPDRADESPMSDTPIFDRVRRSLATRRAGGPDHSPPATVANLLVEPPGQAAGPTQTPIYEQVGQLFADAGSTTPQGSEPPRPRRHLAAAHRSGVGDPLAGREIAAAMHGRVDQTLAAPGPCR
jgi:hypothetical protein